MECAACPVTDVESDRARVNARARDGSLCRVCAPFGSFVGVGPVGCGCLRFHL